MYTDSERQIYGPYPVGGANLVYGDPLHLHRCLVHHTQGRLNQLLDEARAGLDDRGHVTDDNPDVEAKRFDSTNKLIAATVAAFGITPFSGRRDDPGLMEDEILGVLSTFLKWLEKKDQREGSTPTSGQPTSFPESQPTTSTSNSSSTWDEYVADTYGSTNKAPSWPTPSTPSLGTSPTGP